MEKRRENGKRQKKRSGRFFLSFYGDGDPPRTLFFHRDRGPARHFAPECARRRAPQALKEYDREARAGGGMGPSREHAAIFQRHGIATADPERPKTI